MSLESNIDENSVIAENEKKVNNFVANNLSKDYLAEKIFGKEKISKRDIIKNYHGKFLTRNGFKKYMNNSIESNPKKNNYELGTFEE